MKRLLTILMAIGLISPIFIAAQAARAEDCQWTQQITVVSEAGYQYLGGCTETEQKSCANQCSGTTKPESSTNMTRHIGYLCCPMVEAELPTLPAPKFKIPELQVNIFQNQEKFSEVECTTQDGQNYKCAIPWIGEYIKAIYNYGVGIAGILAAIVLMAGGVLWLVSGGDASRITQAKELITGSVTGLIILMSSYVILNLVNPDLVNFRPITIGATGERQTMNKMIKAKNSSQATTYRDYGCASDQELGNGSEFFATGYCKPEWANTKKFFCLIAMNCSCPKGKDTSQNCDEYFSNFKGYAPCAYFDSNTEYCNKTASGGSPGENTIAGPDCSNLPFGTQVCFKTKNGSKTYTINDRGGAIKGHRIDIWTGTCSGASGVTGAGTLTKGPCK